MSVELSRVDAVERALCEDSNVACNPNTLIARSVHAVTRSCRFLQKARVSDLQLEVHLRVVAVCTYVYTW